MQTAAPHLPIDEHLPHIVDLARRRRRLVLVAPPGTGKTTRVAPALTALGPVIMLQPRRVAARAIARRIAEEQGWRLGEEVGWQIRFERRFSARTRLLVATEGILTARLQSDPLLNDFSVAILDEFHERSVHADVALALLKQAAIARDDLVVVVMSATLEGQKVADYLGDCPVFEVRGALYPVDVEYAPNVPPVDAIAGTLARPGGHILAFLPGASEIAAAEAELRRRGLPPGVTALPLHGRLDSSAQDRALAPSEARKVILATNIAETSLTVEGVTDVIDSGYHKVLRLDPRIGVDRLELERIPADSAEQRAGRAGRLGPGKVLRLWDGRERLHPRREPEIRRVDLAAPFLDVLAWGADPLTLDWFEAPDSERARAALDLLAKLGLLEGGRLTFKGNLARQLPLHPRLATLMIEAGASRRAARVCAALSEGRLDVRVEHATVSDALSLADAVEAEQAALERVAAEIHRTAERALRSRGASQGDERLLRAILAGYPDRVARRRAPRLDSLLLASGHGARLGKESGVREGEFLVALEVIGAKRGAAAEALVTKASLIEKEWLEPTETETTYRFDPESEIVRAVARSKYMSIALEERPVKPDPEIAGHLLMGALRERGLDEKELRFLRRAERAGVKLDLDTAIREACAGQVRLPRLDLKRRLSSSDVRRIDRLSPEFVVVPSGRQVPLDYRADGSVHLSVKLQEMFGLRETPKIGQPAAPVVLELLAPNGRPAQVTQDLSSFWKNGYPEVRRQLRGRYPRHPWPEDPLSAPPTARAKPRQS